MAQSARHHRRLSALFILLFVLTAIPAHTTVEATPLPPTPPRELPAAKPGPAAPDGIAPASVDAATGSGVPVGSTFPIDAMATNVSYPAVAYNSHDQEYLVVWQTDAPNAGNIWAARVARDGRVLGNYDVESGGGYTRSNPDVAYNEQDHDYYVVWQYQDGTYMRIRGKPFDPTGPTYGGMQLSTGAALKNCYEPAIAYASSAHSFIVVWERHVTSSLASDIEAQILTGGGSFDGNNFFIKQGAINNSHSQPDVAYNRSRNEYLVAWTQRIATGPEYDVIGRIITHNGVLLGNDLLIGWTTKPDRSPAVAAIPTVPNYGGYLVAWELESAAGNHDIYVRAVPGRAGIDPALPFGTTIPLGNSVADEKLPAIAGSEAGDRYLVTWSEAYPPPFTANVGIRGREAAPDGKALGSVLWAGGAFSGRSAVAAGAGWGVPRRLRRGRSRRRHEYLGPPLGPAGVCAAGAEENVRRCRRLGVKPEWLGVRQAPEDVPPRRPWHCLYLSPLPHGQGSLRPTAGSFCPSSSPSPVAALRRAAYAGWSGSAAACLTIA